MTSGVSERVSSSARRGTHARSEFGARGVGFFVCIYNSHRFVKSLEDPKSSAYNCLEYLVSHSCSIRIKKKRIRRDPTVLEYCMELK